MIKNIPIKLSTGLLLTAYFVGSPAGAAEIVVDDLITSSNKTSAWQSCDANSIAIDVANLDAGGCAYRTTPVSAGVTYSLTCGITVAKYASITLSYLDADDNTLATDSTEVVEHVTGVYSVKLQAPANTVTAAIGIYGEPGSGFQDCVLVDATPVETPTKGRIGGVTWFDENGDSVFNDTENFITKTPVTLYSDGVEVKQSVSKVSNGRFYFGNLDLEQCYTVDFGTADSTLVLGATGGDNDAGANGVSEEICLTANSPYQWNIDAAYVSVAPVAAPADYVICGNAWHDADASGDVNTGDSRIENVRVQLFDSEGTKLQTVDTETGRYVFSDLIEGDYSVRILKTDDYEAIASHGSIEHGKSFVASNGRTPVFNVPADANNNNPDSACSVAHVNGLYTKTEVALDPTVANDDSVTAYVGQDIRTPVLENDDACDGVFEVDLINHDVPGRVYFNGNTEKFVILDTTEAGTFSIEYGLRGVCGSYDTATVEVIIKEEATLIPIGAPAAPVCRIETRGNTNNGGVDVFSDSENDFAPVYKLYNRDKEFVAGMNSNEYTHKQLLGNDLSGDDRFDEWIGNWEIEWNGAEYGFDQVSIYYISALESGLESELTECTRTLMSPIALDLENQGRIKQISGSFEVDLDNDGVKEALSRWFAPTAGILVNDNASGKVTGQDLYGNIPGVYADGFEELATLDVNADGQLTNEELVGLAIWTDLNSDTMVDASELSSLGDHNIVSLAVHHTKFMARAKLSNGKSMLMEDVWLPYAPMAALAK